MKNRKHTLQVTVIALALLAGLMSPITVHAGGGTLPPRSETTTPEPTEVIPIETPTPEPIDVVPHKPGVDVIRTQPPPRDPTATSTPTPFGDATEPAPEPTELVQTSTPETTGKVETPALTDVMQELPEDTGVVVLDENGQVLPLVSQSVSNILIQSDPMWCPEGIVPGGAGCTSAFATLTDLLSNAGGYINSQNTNGVIWITAGAVADTNPIAIDGTTYTNWSNYGLTLQGGWSGNNLDPTIAANSVFFVPVTIANWNNDVTVSNITTSDSIGIINDPWGTTTNQIRNVTVENVTARHLNVTTNSSGNTISILNSSFTDSGFDGVYIDGWYNNVSISNSHFDNNQGHGLVVYNGWGGITVTNSTFDRNIHHGAALVFPGALTINNSTFNGNSGDGLAISEGDSVIINHSEFVGNNSTGLWAESYWGTFVLNNITASHNYAGATVSSWYGGIAMTGTNIFNGNLAHGLSVNTNGDIMLNNVNASSNSIGVTVFSTGIVNLSGGAFINNDTGLVVQGADCINFYFPPTIFTNNVTDILFYNDQIDPTCQFYIPPTHAQTFLQTQGEPFTLDCVTAQHRYVVRLANGDRGEIYCPVTGKASIDRVDNTTLPSTLPSGFTYASAFDVSILKNDEPISVITEGGHIVASFIAPNVEFGNSYSILYWDEKNSTWIPLKDFLLDQNGNAESFELYPGDSEDERKIFSGVNRVTKNGEARVEVSTNFPGIFVLAQH